MDPSHINIDYKVLPLVVLLVVLLPAVPKRLQYIHYKIDDKK
jgi:hypothetical protein